MTSGTDLRETTSEGIKEHVIKILDHLISLNRDAVEGFNTAAELVENPQYATICREFAEQREQFINELVHMVNGYGGNPTDTQTIASVIHEAWMNIRQMVSGDDAAVLAECDRGEDVAVETYHAALQESLPEDVETLIRAQFARLKGAYERIHRLSAALNQ